MPPRTVQRSPQIPGLVPRSGAYRVTTLAEIDANLLGLKAWLCAMLDRAPEFGTTYVRHYNADRDALLDFRLVLMSSISGEAP